MLRPNSLFDPTPPVWRYVCRVGLLSLIPSVLVALLVGLTLRMFIGDPDAYAPDLPKATGWGSKALLLLFFVAIGPLLETTLMAAILRLLSFITRHPGPLAAMSALVWAFMHGLAAPAWGLVIAWPFYVFSRAYLAWRPLGRWPAIAVAAAIHGFQNLLPSIAAIFGP